jgi:hypothetical protein
MVVGNFQAQVLSATGIDGSNWLGVLCDLGVETFLSQCWQVTFIFFCKSLEGLGDLDGVI